MRLRTVLPLFLVAGLAASLPSASDIMFGKAKVSSRASTAHSSGLAGEGGAFAEMVANREKAAHVKSITPAFGPAMKISGQGAMNFLKDNMKSSLDLDDSDSVPFTTLLAELESQQQQQQQQQQREHGLRGKIKKTTTTKDDPLVDLGSSFRRQGPGITEKGWRVFVVPPPHPRAGQTFWYNEATHQKTWNKPAEAEQQHEAREKAKNAAGGGGGGGGGAASGAPGGAAGGATSSHWQTVSTDFGA